MPSRFGLRGPPSPGRQAAHAVRDDHRRESGRQLETAHRVGNGLAIVVDGAEHGFEADGDAGDVVVPQAPQPPIPETAIAEEAMDEKDSTPTLRSRKVIALALRPEWLAPQEDAGRDRDLENPRADQLTDSRTRIVAFGIGRSQPGELDRQYGAVAENDEPDESRREPRRSGRRADDDRSNRQQQQRCGDE